MSDLRHDQDLRAGLDAFYQQMVICAAQACAGWAEVVVDRGLDLLVWPRVRGDFPDGPGYPVNTRVVQRGVWRVALQPELPAGIDQGDREAVLRAETALDALRVPMSTINRVVQCGLFGEVLHR